MALVYTPFRVLLIFSLKVKVSLLNFTITIKGLEEQLLNTAVKEELPDLAQKKVPACCSRCIKKDTRHGATVEG